MYICICSRQYEYIWFEPLRVQCGPYKYTWTYTRTVWVYSYGLVWGRPYMCICQIYQESENEIKTLTKYKSDATFFSMKLSSNAQIAIEVMEVHTCIFWKISF